MKLEKIVGLGFIGFITLWLLGFVITLAFWAAVIYVAWHFISKFW